MLLTWIKKFISGGLLWYLMLGMHFCYAAGYTMTLPTGMIQFATQTLNDSDEERLRFPVIGLRTVGENIVYGSVCSGVFLSESYLLTSRTCFLPYRHTKGSFTVYMIYPNPQALQAKHFRFGVHYFIEPRYFGNINSLTSGTTGVYALVTDSFTNGGPCDPVSYRRSPFVSYFDSDTIQWINRIINM